MAGGEGERAVTLTIPEGHALMMLFGDEKGADLVPEGVKAVIRKALGRVQYVLEYDHGNFEDVFEDYPPEPEIEDARKAASDSWTQIVVLVDGVKRFVVAEFPPVDSDPLRPQHTGNGGTA